jgi:Calcineurin-like phosphoesterase
MRGALAIAVLACLLGVACAPVGPSTHARPDPGAITTFEPGVGETRLAPTSDPAGRMLGTAGASGADSVVVVLYGDNRPGQRMMTTPQWGLPTITEAMRSTDPRAWVWGLVNVPVALVQGFIPTADGFQDALSVFITHRPNGGNEKGVREAIESLPDFAAVLNTGDLIPDGKRGKQWDDFVARHATLRARAPYVAAMGNHESGYSSVGSANWDAAMGRPPSEGRHWYAFDLPDSLARFVILDSNLFTDPHQGYSDSTLRALGEAQLAWADSALAAPRTFKFLVFHHPLASAGHYFKDWTRSDAWSPPARSRLLAMARARGVTAVLTGHEHLYQRMQIVDPRGGRLLPEITTGGGGSPLVRIPRQRREQARRQMLPDSSTVRFADLPRSVYHVCRLVFRRGPAPTVTLVVDAVDRGGRMTPIERLRIDTPSEAE